MTETPEGSGARLLELTSALIVTAVDAHSLPSTTGTAVAIVDLKGYVDTGYDVGDGEERIDVTNRIVIPRPFVPALVSVLLSAAVFGSCTCPPDAPSEEFHPHDD